MRKRPNNGLFERKKPLPQLVLKYLLFLRTTFFCVPLALFLFSLLLFRAASRCVSSDGKLRRRRKETWEGGEREVWQKRGGRREGSE